MVRLVLILTLALVAPAAADDRPLVARTGDHVRVRVGDHGTITGELVRTTDGELAIRREDDVTTFPVRDLTSLEVSPSGPVPDHSKRLAWALGGGTFVGGWVIYFTAEDTDGDGNGWSAFAEGLQQTVGVFVVFAGTPVMAGLGWFMGATAEADLWHEARLEDDVAVRTQRLRRDLERERSRRAPARPFGPSFTGSF